MTVAVRSEDVARCSDAECGGCLDDDGVCLLCGEVDEEPRDCANCGDGQHPGGGCPADDREYIEEDWP